MGGACLGTRGCLAVALQQLLTRRTVLVCTLQQSTNEYYRNIYADPDLGPIFKVRARVSWQRP